MIWFITLVMIYLIGAFLTYGFTFAYFRGEFPESPYRDDVKDSLIQALFSWIGLAIHFIKADFKHGFRLY